jgi:FtsH-binding integral membrane protein
MDKLAAPQYNHWNRVSIGLFLLGLIAGGLMLLPNSWDFLMYGVITFSVMCLLGLCAAIAAAVRTEKPVWLTWAGLILNSLVILTFIFLVVL